MSEFDLDLLELRKDFILTLIEDLNDVESTLIDIEKSSDKNELIRKTFGLVHSIKGGASSYQLNVLTAICHRFEDYISSYSEEDEVSIFIDQCLKFVDIIKQCAKESLSSEKDLDKFLAYLDDLNTNETELHGRALLVETTKSIGKIIEKTLNEYGYDVSMTNDGAQAFNRLLSERFDMLITSVNVHTLDGQSLIQCVKATNNKNRGIPTIILSSDDPVKGDFIFDSDYHLKKSENFLENAKRVFKTILAKEEQDIKIESILYVEDDSRIQKLFSMVVNKKSDASLEMVSTGDEALKVLEQFIPDVIMLDYFLEKETGVDVFKRISQVESLKDVPVVFLTAAPESVDLGSLRKIGNVKGVIAKPINLKSIMGEIASILKK